MVQKVEITLSYDDERVEAMEFYLKKEDSTVQKKMEAALGQLYETLVPEEVREYIDRKTVPARPKRTPKSSRPTQPAAAPMPEFGKEEP